jgi:cyclase
MEELPPARLAALFALARLTQRLGKPARRVLRALGHAGIKPLGAVGRAAPFVMHAFGRYELAGLRLVPPTRTFDGELTLDVGGRAVRLIEVGPAHTQGDVIVHVPDARIVFTGDILFTEAHPIVWAGPFSSWIAACERIEALAPEHVVPGHGRLSTLADVRATREYLDYVFSQAKLRHAAGMSASAAARDIQLDGRFSHWREAERIVANVTMAYRELEGAREAVNAIELFANMGEYWEERTRAHV